MCVMPNLLLTYGAGLWPQKGTKGIVASEWNLPWLWHLFPFPHCPACRGQELLCSLTEEQLPFLLSEGRLSGLESGSPQREWSEELLQFNSFWLTESVCRGAFSPPRGSGHSVPEFLYFVKTLGVMGLFRLWSHWKVQRSTHLLTLMFDCVWMGLPSCPAGSSTVREDGTVPNPLGEALLILSFPGGPHT